HGYERRRDGRVGKQRADEVRDLERDREGVDPSGGAEVVGGNDLADEPEDSREAGCEREDRRRPSQSAARASPVHVASIGTGSAVPEAAEARTGGFCGAPPPPPPPPGGGPLPPPPRPHLPPPILA